MLRCPICPARAVEPLGEKDDLDVFRCSACHLVYRTHAFSIHYAPLYAEAQNYHQDERARVGADGFVSTMGRLEHDLKVARARLEVLQGQVPPPPSSQGRVLLDFGASNGALVLSALGVGYDAHGMEPSAGIVKAAVSVSPSLAGRMHVGDTVRGFHRPVDIITAHDVIEHLLDPTMELAAMVLRLSVGGYLLIEQPDPTCSEALEQGLSWKHVKPREHIWLFAETHFDQILRERLGMEKVSHWTPIQGRMGLLYRKPI